MADNDSRGHSSTSAGKASETSDVTIHEAQFGKSGKASDMSIVISSGEAARRVRGKGKGKEAKEEKK
ncbi:bZIP transcription factor domain-containing protein [Purpureocillium lavendulum]|uniref:BZIP transcription factor domain-containing protein n=1 Tax=Purpureocillium lavendulum TaxID=1247861 RepID=A0AB34FII3_9HYPO|nr:bZIP transcription factor domain-containing protein [Purpureocillium lavendulum]